MKTKSLRLRLFIVFTLFSTVLISCQNNTQTQKETSVLREEKSKFYKLIGENITIYNGPGENFDKLINKNATELIGKTQYCNADNTFLVEVIEHKGEWTKIKTIQPEHLSDTYNGWIKTKFIKKDNKPDVIKELDALSFEIIKEVKKPVVTNYHILIKQHDFNKEKANDFIKSFRKFKCKGDCNINLYDSKEIIPLIDKYTNLKDFEYLIFADHYIASSSFDAPESAWWYPYQDFKYKELGGKNWKKEPIK